MAVRTTYANVFSVFLKPKREPGLLSKYMRDIESGCFEVPRSFDILRRYETEELKLRHSKALELRFPENTLMKEFYVQHPEAKLEPVTLNSFQMPLAKQFAVRQLQLMETGVSKAAAYKAVEEELQPRILAVQRGELASGTHLELAQREEEQALDAALKLFMEKKMASGVM
ncbi:MAG: hypothetical protein WDW38_004562 [Sanguina aurantia]